MSKYFMEFLLGIFLIYISVCSYKFIRYRKVEKTVLRFMTSCMILFTFTIVCYNDGFFNENENNLKYIGFSAKDESKVFLSSTDEENIVRPLPHYDSSLKNNDSGSESVQKQEIETKVTAYFDNASPARGSITNLIVTGPPKGRVTAICQYEGHGTPYIMPIGENGLAVIPIKVESEAKPGVIVVVDISISYNGKLYKLNSVFTPQ